ncbi:MAG TPA: STAS domain-containing protein [Gaiellaceae bacterium]|nr:STAS domain-containing protein [Gaiellaceae bacterium]
MGAFALEHVDLDDPAIAVAVLSGELDLTNVGELVEELEDLTAGRALVLDLNRLLFIDSAALHALFRLARSRAGEGLAVVIEPGAPVAATLAIVDFRQAATVVESRDEAFSAFVRS